MRILFDQGTPVPLRDHLHEHLVVTAYEAEWATLSNGELLSAAESRFDLLITTDKNLRYQQTVVGRQIAILVLPTTSWPRIRAHIQLVVAAVNGMRPGQLVELGGFDE
jgi:hypothetical protein